MNFTQYPALLQETGCIPVPAIQRLDGGFEFHATGCQPRLQYLKTSQRTIFRIAIQQRSQQPSCFVVFLLSGRRLDLPSFINRGQRFFVL